MHVKKLVMYLKMTNWVYQRNKERKPDPCNRSPLGWHALGLGL